MFTSPTPADRIVTLTALVVAALALLSLVAMPTWHVVQIHVLGSELSVQTGGRTLALALLVVLTALGVDDLVRTVPALRNVSVRYTATFWILPSLVTIAAASAVPSLASANRAWLSSLLLLGLLLLLVLLASYGTARPGGAMQRLSRLALNFAAYGAAFALYATIYSRHTRSLLSISEVFLVTFPLALELLRGTEEQVETTWLYAGVIALVNAELTWALNALALTGLAGGALLLLAFYTMSGVSQQHLAGRLTPRVALEFVSIGILGSIVIAATPLAG